MFLPEGGYLGGGGCRVRQTARVFEYNHLNTNIHMYTCFKSYDERKSLVRSLFVVTSMHMIINEARDHAQHVCTNTFIVIRVFARITPQQQRSFNDLMIFFRVRVVVFPGAKPVLHTVYSSDLILWLAINQTV